MSASLSPVEWKPEEVRGNWMVAQREIATVGIVAEPHRLPAEVLAKCTFAGTLSECIRHDGRNDNEICLDLHISAGYMSKFLRSVGANWCRRMVLFMRTTNCIAPLQKLADEMGCDVIVRASQAARIAHLEAELANVRRSA